MHFKKKFIQKIFSINVKPKFICSKEKKSPEDRYGKCVDKILMDFKKSPQNLSNFKKCEDEMLSIHYDFLDQSNELLDEKYGITPVERMKKFQEKMKNKIINEEGEEEMQEENLSNNNKKFLDNRDSESEDLFILEKKKNMIKTTNKKAEDPISKKNEIFDKVTSSNEKGTKKINSKADEKYFESSSRGLNFIPQNLIIKTLKFPKNGSEVLLLGVENRNSNHASFMIDLLNKLKVDNIVTQLAPDQPFFIKTEDAYKAAWERFLRGKFDYKFVVNPNPQNLVDLILDANRLKFLMDGSFLKSSSQFELGSTFFYSKRYSTQRFEVDCLLTPFLYSYNNSEKMIPVIVNDFPIILYREYIARNINLEDLLSIYDTFVVEQQKKNINFDPALLKPEIFIKPKINYITEVLRQSCFLGKKIMAVVDINCAEFIANAWMDYGKHENLEKFQNLLSVSKLQNEDKNLTFSDYIQKHVILDLILDNFVQENFVQYKSFPFSGKGTVGRDMNFGNLFMIWNHFQRKFKRSQTNLKTLDDIKNGQETMADFEDGEHVQKTFKNIEKKMFR